MVAAEPIIPPEASPRIDRLGHIFAWICCAFYLTSRLPQILENHRRKSTKGINIALFMAALCGNTCYTIGITTNPLAHDTHEQREFLLNALPYLLGSAGTIMFDITILLQYCRYQGQEPAEIDREAIKRYLTTDESWLQHRWSAVREKWRFPFSISFHDGPCRYEEVIEGVEDDTNGARVGESAKDDDERSALLVKTASSRSYGSQ